MTTPSPNRQAVLVGLFSAVALAILGGGILTIGSLSDTFARTITVRAVFDEVSGLQEGDNVWFSGVKVGTVRDLSFSGRSQVEVRMTIHEEALPFIRTDVHAEIGSDGLIGSTIIVLSGGEPTSGDLKDGDVLVSDPAVSAGDIMATLQQNNENLLVITADIRALTGRLASGEGTFGKLLADDAMAEQVAGAIGSLSLASADAGRATASLSAFTSELNRSGGLPNSVVTDRTTYASLVATVDELHQASTRMADLVDGLATGTADPRTPIGSLMHDPAMAADLKETLANLREGSDLLNEDLTAVQHNFLFRRYFRKQEKASKKASRDAADLASP